MSVAGCEFGCGDGIALWVEQAHGVFGEVAAVGGLPFVVEAAVDAAAMGYGVYDHYDVASAFIKSIRGSDPDAGLYWLARMLEAGEDPRFMARRLVILASEDVGMATRRECSWPTPPPGPWSTWACPRRP